MFLLMLLMTTTCSLLAVLSVPLILMKVPPNPWYGFRVPKTLRDPEIWYPANAFAGRRLLVVGLVGAIAAIGLYQVPNIEIDTYSYTCGAIVVGGLFITVIQSLLYLRQFPSSR